VSGMSGDLTVSSEVSIHWGGQSIYCKVSNYWCEYYI